ncbi:unnamed protein product [Auanema sp. JU1783]|nr:unnamed protein product [Auanema sp. JU1783]
MINTKPRKGSNTSEKLNVLVAVRVRPMNEEEKVKSQSIVKADGLGKVVSCKSKQFGPFDYVYPPNSSQLMVFDNIVEPQVKKILAGFNCTVFAYGQTGTGKTYTMEGGQADSDSADADEHTGMTPRAVELIFSELENAGVEEYSVRVSYLELYNEEIYDLLSSGTEDRERLRIFDDPSKKGAVIVSGAEEVPVRSRKEVYDILKRGAEKRTVASTLMNIASSRSHSIFSISVVIRENTESGEELVKTGKLNLVDLAGSENIGRSGAEGKRMKEAGNINQSLLTLGRVITALTSSGPHVPYRESKLTRLLQDSLGGSTITAIIATMSPSASNYEESISTLEYAMRAKSIKNHPECNQKVSRKTLLKEYNNEIEKLRRDLRMAREKNGIFISEETYNDMEKDIAIKNELAAKMDMMVSKLQRFIEDMEMMDDQYKAAYQTNKRLQSKLETRVQELDLTKKDLAMCQQKLSAHQFALDDFSEVAKSCYQQAKQACEVTSKQRTLIEELWKKDDEMVDLAASNKSLVMDTFRKLGSVINSVRDRVNIYTSDVHNVTDNKLVDIDSFHVSTSADLEVVTAILQKLSAEVDDCVKQVRENSKATEESIQAINTVKNEAISSIMEGITKSINGHVDQTTELTNSFEDMFKRIKSLTGDLVQDTKSATAENREKVSKLCEEHSVILDSVASESEKYQQLMQTLLKSFYDQSLQAVAQYKEGLDNSAKQLQSLNTQIVDSSSNLDELITNDVQGAEDNILEVVYEMEENSKLLSSNISETKTSICTALASGSQTAVDWGSQIEVAYGAFNENLVGISESSSTNQKTFIETGQSAVVRVQTTISDETEDTSAFVKDLASKAKTVNIEQENGFKTLGSFCDDCENEWASEANATRKEKKHQQMFEVKDIRQVPKKKDVLNEYGADKFDEKSLVRTRESLLEIRNLCSPDTLALKKKSRFDDIEEEENYDVSV